MSDPGVAADNERPEHGWQLADAAARLHALGIHRPSEGPAVVLVPRDASGDEARALGEVADGPDRPAAEVATSRFTAGEIQDLIAAIGQRDWTATAKQYTYAFGYDAATDVVLITTSAPPDERRVIAERFGDRVQVQYGEGTFRRT